MNNTNTPPQEARALAQELKIFFREGAHDLKKPFSCTTNLGTDH